MKYCEICDKQLVNKQNRFCSQRCSGDWKKSFYKNKYVGKDNPRWSSEETKCLMCKKQFFAQKSSLEKGFSKYCSHHCYSLSLKKLTGEKSAKYKKERYSVDEQTGCWNWLLSTTKPDKFGKFKYGILTVNNKRWRAHRFYYEKYKGKIPKGMHLDHLCRNTLCINPDHLEPVKNRENIHRGNSTKLTDEDVKKIREMKKETAKEIAEMYGVSPVWITRILNNQVRLWKNSLDKSEKQA